MAKTPSDLPPPEAAKSIAIAKDKVSQTACPTGAGFAPAFFTTKQLAVRWALSERQVHRYIANDELIATRFGRSVRVSVAEVARFEAARAGVS